VEKFELQSAPQKVENHCSKGWPT